MPAFIRSADWRYYLLYCADLPALRAAMPTDEESGQPLWPWDAITGIVRPGHYETQQDDRGTDVQIYVRDPGTSVAGIAAVDVQDPARWSEVKATIKAHCEIARATKANAQAMQQAHPEIRFKELGRFAGQVIPNSAPDYDGD